MAGGIEVADVFRRHGPAFRATHSEHLDRDQRRVMGAIEACRTAALGGHTRRCADCGHTAIAYNIRSGRGGVLHAGHLIPC